MIEHLKILAVTTIDAEIKETNLPEIAAGRGNLGDVLQIVIGIVAALSLLFIVIGGLRYVLSDGDPQNASKAKSTIIYSLVGLLIAIAAQAIVSFVLREI